MSVTGVLFGGVLAPATAQSTPTPTDPTNDTANSAMWNNSTAAHANPATIDERGDLGRVSNWLAGRMQRQFASSALELSQGDYELARKFVGEEYRDNLGQYVDVAGATQTTSDDAAAEAYRTASEAQSTLINQTQAFERAETAYQNARNNGSIRKARRYAHKMNTLATRIEDTRDAIVKANSRLEEALGVEDPLTIEPINETVARIQNNSQTALSTTLENTTLSLLTAESTTSPVDPLHVTGRLEHASGVPLTNETVTIVVGGEPSVVRLNQSGVFEVSYTPRERPPGQQTLSVAYRPEPTTQYLGDNVSLPVTIRTVNASVTLTGSPPNGSFGARIPVRGHVTVSNTSIQDVRISGSLGTADFTTRTNGTGQFHTTVPIPPDIAAGPALLRVAVDSQEPLVQSPTATATIQVLPLNTTLSVSNESRGGTQFVRGELQTERGDPVPNQPIRLSYAGGETRTVRTNASGWYRGRIPVAQEFAGETILVTASFQSGPSHLRSSSASTTLELASFQPGTSHLQSSSASTTLERLAGDSPEKPGSLAQFVKSLIPAWQSRVSLAIAALGLGLAGLVVYWRRRQNAARHAQPQFEPSESSGVAPDTPTDQSQETTRSVDIKGAANKRDAIHRSYRNLRDQFAQTFGLQNPETLTLREFQQELAPQIDTGGALETVSEIYDQVIYGGKTPDSDTIKRYTRAQKRLLAEVQDTVAGDGGEP